MGVCSFCPRLGYTRFHNIAASLGGSWSGDWACENCRICHNQYNQKIFRSVKFAGPTELLATVSTSTLNFIGSTIEANKPFVLPAGSIVSLEIALVNSFDRTIYPTIFSSAGGTSIITGSPEARMYLAIAYC